MQKTKTKNKYKKLKNKNKYKRHIYHHTCAPIEIGRLDITILFSMII